MNEIVGYLNVFEGSGEALRVKSITLDYLDPWPHLAGKLQRFTGHHPHTVTPLEKRRHKPAADISGGTGNEDPHPVHLRVIGLNTRATTVANDLPFDHVDHILSDIGRVISDTLEIS